MASVSICSVHVAQVALLIKYNQSIDQSINLCEHIPEIGGCS